ncbi:hypothetical protein [Maribellus sp. YY47]|uniref:hypothetical protein n=1 Tax=Maribellus sp. YY47 TaxID=2929486 RepID=UPI0020019557|nr:hypothetical protein [Maribellus sp. YY47]MCK3683637.1 hypothetical protein [Maribellus sp. YY47]
MEFIRRHNKLWFALMLPVYLFIVNTSIQNKHTHFYANGMVVTHSHPIHSGENEPANHHGHAKTEICFFSTLHFDVAEVPLYISSLAKLPEIHFEYFVQDAHLILSDQDQRSNPRAPPVA